MLWTFKYSSVSYKCGKCKYYKRGDCKGLLVYHWQDCPGEVIRLGYDSRKKKNS